MVDRAGNTRSDARRLRLSSTAKTVSDAVSLKDRDDFYKVRLRQKSQLNLTLSNLEANANLELLQKNGTVIARSAQRGTRNETIKKTVAEGTYFIRVYPKGKSNTKYKLTGSATTDSVTAASSTTSTFNIQFDYRFDSTNWFTAERRAVLNAAAKVWENIILDEFANVPAGKSIKFTNPTTGAAKSFNLETEIDDLLVFVGTGQTGGGLAVGGPFGSWTVGSSLDTRFNGSDFEPWTGDISFNPNVNWFFDSTPDTAGDIPRNANDFFSVAVHELGHVLGIGTSDALDRLISNAQFTGVNSKALNNGNPIPLVADGGHVKDDVIGHSKKHTVLRIRRFLQ
ncbi:MAG: pre-peptidase C-terminal domain-containing protein, partial [Synechococcales cyanobacterium T60_A2020_003]|nr:pre-peptidase C-terminal domain-containing protein [Synechococcales cyanobacterium T60_A2020_003]